MKTTKLGFASFGSKELTKENELHKADITVYRRWCIKDGIYFNKSYVGVTTDIVTRNRKWDNWHTMNYAGLKLTTARQTTESTDWKSEILFIESFIGTKKEIEDECDELEIKYVAKFDSYYHGFNGNQGGRGMRGADFTQTHRDRIGAKSKGRKMPPASVAKRAAKLKNIPRPTAVKAKISKTKTGQKHTPAQNAAQSARMKGKTPIAACKGAEKWREENVPWWKTHPILTESIEKRKNTVREKAQRIKVTNSNNEITCYLCQTDAAQATGVADGSIKYAMDNTNGLHAKSGYRFERISDEEYQEWERQNRA